ncbi:lytic murein transglycosylase [Methylobacterium organophilum]|uniref:lytic murein transglycosylase n=1 Tax=Methylobacterium organophilum TaxID=410 RepID=UPI001F145866|nr:lytic murein transglycosylase [Methylobacterium organophilum]UMY18871.1 lytic murein transglycosylase [Methylobacterium organophilum]
MGRGFRRGIAGAALLLGLAPGCAAAESAPSDPALPAASFPACFGALAALAQARGISEATVSAQFGALAPDPVVLPATGAQAEFVRPLWDYLDASVTPERIATGQAKLAEWAEALARIEAAYGVDRHVLVAFWGVESNFGRAIADPKGLRPVVPALATLACGEPARAATWRDELIAALTILDRGEAPAEGLFGSWAGAMGHTQFMPTAYLRHAVDFDGDGRRDIWHAVPDALASTADFLKAAGWRAHEGWGREVSLPEGFDHRLADETTERVFSEWAALGVKPAGPLPFPEGARAVLLLPAGARGPAFLLQPNFKVILRYNTALAYALTVAHLADRLAGAPAFAAPWPRGDRMLTTPERRELQTTLAVLGYAVGAADGKVGPKTRAAIRAYQEKAGLTPDGYAEPGLLEKIRAERPASP